MHHQVMAQPWYVHTMLDMAIIAILAASAAGLALLYMVHCLWIRCSKPNNFKRNFAKAEKQM